MAYYTRPRTPDPFFASRSLAGVKWLLVLNIALYLLSFAATQSGYGALFYPFGLIPRMVLDSFALWQPITYLFLHDPTGVTHILFNMLTLWWFGSDLENTWGTRKFLEFYFLCGLGAALCVIVANALFGSLDSRTIGASGAIYGLLLAFGVLNPDRPVMFSFLFPMKAKYFVIIIGVITFLYSVMGSSNGVSHVAHLGGMLFGYLFLKTGVLDRSRRRTSPSWFAGLHERYRQWKIARAKRKFQVYMQKHDKDRGPMVH